MSKLHQDAVPRCIGRHNTAQATHRPPDLHTGPPTQAVTQRGPRQRGAGRRAEGDQRGAPRHEAKPGGVLQSSGLATGDLVAIATCKKSLRLIVGHDIWDRYYVYNIIIYIIVDILIYYIIINICNIRICGIWIDFQKYDKAHPVNPM